MSAKTTNEAASNDNKLNAMDTKSRQASSSKITNDGFLDKRKKKVDIPYEIDYTLIKEKPKRKVSFNSPRNKTNFFNSATALANHSPISNSLEKKQKKSVEREV